MESKTKISRFVEAGLALGIILIAALSVQSQLVSAQVVPVLNVNPGELVFGIVFPGESLDKTFKVAMSDSFFNEGGKEVDYTIKYKPKPRNPIDTDYCHQNAPQNPGNPSDPYYAKCYPVLCNQLSSIPDNSPANDAGVTVPHEIGAVATGRLAVAENDISDDWKVDLEVPCFQGMCDQKYSPSVYGNPLPVGLESQDFGCDLWVEVTNVVIPTPTPTATPVPTPTPSPTPCINNADLMLVLDRSSSINAGELASLKKASHAFVNILNPGTGVHMGISSFSTTGSLSLNLTGIKTKINASIDLITTNGYTNLYEGIKYANLELADTDPHERPAVPDYMIIITDGNANRPLPDSTARTLAANEAAAARSAGVEIFVVGVGSDVDAVYLKSKIATDEWHYYAIAHYEGLSTALHKIATCGRP